MSEQKEDSNRDKENKARYFASPKGRAAIRKYLKSEKGKEALSSYSKSEKGKLTRLRYYNSEKAKKIREARVEMNRQARKYLKWLEQCQKDATPESYAEFMTLYKENKI